MQTLTLSELNEFLRRVIALNFTESVWVSCEIAQIKESRGHWYLDLIEKQQEGKEVIAQLPAIIWAMDYAALKRKLGEHVHSVFSQGTQVRLKARMDFHERFGLKLIIEHRCVGGSHI